METTVLLNPAEAWELELSTNFFMLELKKPTSGSLLDFYKSVLTLWVLLKRKRQLSDSLCWLLEEPVLSGSLLDLPTWCGPTLDGKLCAARISEYQLWVVW